MTVSIKEHGEWSDRGELARLRLSEGVGVYLRLFREHPKTAWEQVGGAVICFLFLFALIFTFGVL